MSTTYRQPNGSHRRTQNCRFGRAPAWMGTLLGFRRRAACLRYTPSARTWLGPTPPVYTTCTWSARSRRRTGGRSTCHSPASRYSRRPLHWRGVCWHRTNWANSRPERRTRLCCTTASPSAYTQRYTSADTTGRAGACWGNLPRLRGMKSTCCPTRTPTVCTWPTSTSRTRTRFRRAVCNRGRTSVDTTRRGRASPRCTCPHSRSPESTRRTRSARNRPSRDVRPNTAVARRVSIHARTWDCTMRCATSARRNRPSPSSARPSFRH